MDGFDSKRLDDVLGMFSGVNGGRIPAGLLLNHEETPEDWSRAIEFLTEEGYLKQLDDYFEITYRGKAMLRDGGFFRKDRRERALFYCTIVAAVCSLLGLVVSLSLADNIRLPDKRIKHIRHTPFLFAGPFFVS